MVHHQSKSSDIDAAFESKKLVTEILTLLLKMLQIFTFICTHIMHTTIQKETYVELAENCFQT